MVSYFQWLICDINHDLFIKNIIQNIILIKSTIMYNKMLKILKTSCLKRF